MSRDELQAYTRHEEFMEIFDHDAADPRIGHESCRPRCAPVDRFRVSSQWADDHGEPVTNPALIARLEKAAKE